jgi:soluble lytic murein transglycosylase-like protein
LGLVALILYSAGLLVAAAYVSYKAPIKPDRYGHAFSRHVADRVTAYMLWFKSPSKAEKATMSAEKITQILATTSAKHGVDPCVVTAVAIFESGLNPLAISTTGAVGLMALQPDTARQFSVEDPFDPTANADAGTRLLGKLSQQFHGNVDLVLAAYNGSSDAVEKFHGVPPYRETIDYVNHVGHIYRVCKAEQW